MKINTVNSLVELYFNKSKEIAGKKQFLQWLKTGKKKSYNWEDVTERIFKLTYKIKSLINEGDG